jgi:hypothetical protein
VAKLNATEFADKLITRTRQAQSDYVKGIQRTTVNPAAEASKASAKWQQKVTSSEARDKFTRSLSRVSATDWQNAAINLGAPRLSQGIEAARPKIEAVAGPLLSHIDAGVSKVKGMPSVTLDDNLARSQAFIRHMAEFGKR